MEVLQERYVCIVTLPKICFLCLAPKAECGNADLHLLTLFDIIHKSMLIVNTLTLSLFDTIHKSLESSVFRFCSLRNLKTFQNPI